MSRPILAAEQEPVNLQPHQRAAAHLAEAVAELRRLRRYAMAALLESMICFVEKVDSASKPLASRTQDASKVLGVGE
jgi:hypothetical protein